MTTAGCSRSPPTPSIASSTKPERDKLQAAQKKVGELDVTHPGSPARAMVLNDAPNPTNPHVYIRGNPGRPGKQIPRRFLRVLSPGGEAKPFTEGSGRLELAQAIASPDNPLTPRVMVNRIWHEHFGAGLVTTPSDFGARGEPPTHPELLDFLARRFIESGWSVKAMHRLIMLSTTYQQKSDRRDDAFAADPRNQLLWRQNRRRLDFEAMRDGVLAVSGKLDLTMGGRPVKLFDPNALSTRRTVYGYVDRYELDTNLPDLRLPQPRHQRPDASDHLGPAAGPLPDEQPVPARTGPSPRQPPGSTPGVGPRRPDRPALRDLFGRPAEPHEVEVGRRFVESRPKAEGSDSPTAWEEYAQVLLLTNEFMFVD